MQKENEVMTKHEPSLPTNRAFVVQFRTETDLSQGHCKGRVEHVVSGQSAHFHSLEELVTFMGQVLANMGTSPAPQPESRRR